MANLLKLIDRDFWKELERDAVTAVVLSLQKNDKIVTAKTARSVRAETVFLSGDIAEVQAFGSEGMSYIIEGKKANTKLPVRKVGGRFELVQELKDWKAIRQFGGSDYLLARAIAKNPREGVNIGFLAASEFSRLAGRNISKKLAGLTTVEIQKSFKN